MDLIYGLVGDQITSIGRSLSIILVGLPFILAQAFCLVNDLKYFNLKRDVYLFKKKKKVNEN
jgi:hypothetical protein